MRRSIPSIGITLIIVLLLVVLTQPTSAVLTTVSGPDEIDRGEEAAFSTTVEIREDERIPVEGFNVTLTPAESTGTVVVTFTTDGDVDEVHVTGDADEYIDIDALTASIVLADVQRTADFGYGYLSGTDERTTDDHSFGYGYGYGYGYDANTDGTFTFDVQFDSAALAPGDYTLQVNVNSGANVFASNEFTFSVLPDVVDGTLEVTPETLNLASQGQWVTGYITLDDADVADIELGSVELNGVAAIDDPRYGFVRNPVVERDGEEVFMARFPRDEVSDTVEPGDAVTMTVNGTVDGVTFTATDTIRVIDRGGASGDNRGGGFSDDRDRGQGNPHHDDPHRGPR